jgi:hypothetical protein
VSGNVAGTSLTTWQGMARRILIKGAWRKSILVGTRDINAEMRSM